MKVIVLGCGTSTGVPVIGCQCHICSTDHPRNRRLRASVWMTWNEKGILVDTSTDLRFQAIRNGIPRVDAVLFTHSHADHIHGIDELRSFNALQKSQIPCFGSSATLDYLRQSFAYIFDPIDNGLTYIPRLTLEKIQGPFKLFEKDIVPLEASHGPMGPVLGFRVGRFAYLTDVASVPGETLELMRGLDVLILDALRSAYHPSHLTIEDATKMALEIGAKRTFFTHMSHDVDYDVVNPTLPKGVELAYDGLCIQLDDCND